MDKAALKNLRGAFTAITGLDTYAIPSWKVAEVDLFEADAPFVDYQNDRVLEFLEALKDEAGLDGTFTIRKTRMTISLEA